MLESWEGDMILSIAKSLPAGLHLYRILDGKTTTYKASMLLICCIYCRRQGFHV